MSVTYIPIYSFDKQKKMVFSNTLRPQLLQVAVTFSQPPMGQSPHLKALHSTVIYRFISLSLY